MAQNQSISLAIDSADLVDALSLQSPFDEEKRQSAIMNTGSPIYRESELSDLMKSFQDNSHDGEDCSLNEDVLLEHLNIEESKTEKDPVTNEEKERFGTLLPFFSVELLRAYWTNYKLKTLFPWQIECLTRRNVVQQKSKS